MHLSFLAKSGNALPSIPKQALEKCSFGQGETGEYKYKQQDIDHFNSIQNTEWKMMLLLFFDTRIVLASANLEFVKATCSQFTSAKHFC